MESLPGASRSGDGRGLDEHSSAAADGSSEIENADTSETALAAELMKVMGSTQRTLAAAQAAIDFNPQGRAGSLHVEVPTITFARALKGMPTPLLGRLVRLKSDMPVRILSLCWLWGVSPGDPPADAPWEECLLGNRGKRRGQDRRIQRALAVVADTWRSCEQDLTAWNQSDEGREPSWIFSPDLPIGRWTRVPLSVWSNGWHLVLDKAPLAWLFASYLPSRIRWAMHDRLLGFGRHAHGITAARTANRDVLLAAPGARSVHLLGQLSQVAPHRWPEIHFHRGEIPLEGFRGDDSLDEWFILRTDRAVHIYRWPSQGPGRWVLDVASQDTLPTSDYLPIKLGPDPSGGTLMINHWKNSLGRIRNLRPLS